MNQGEPVTVWGAGTPRTLRAYWALHECGVAFERRVIRTRTPDMDDPAFLARSPGRKVPAFEHGPLVLTESGAIAAYVFERFGSGQRAASERATIARWSYFALTELDATALYVLRRHEGLPQIYGEAPTAVAAARAYFQRQAAVVEDAIGDGRAFIAGDHFSEADVHLVSCCIWARHCDLALGPALEAYAVRQQARPSFAVAMKSNAVE